MELAANQVTSLEVSDIVLAYLAKNGASETPDIAFSTGIAPREISLAIHDLKKHHYVTTIKITDGRTQMEITRHELLPGADGLTAVMVALKERNAAQRRFLAKGHPRVSQGKKGGQKHVHGVAGKIDLTKIPKGVYGKIYLALTKDNMAAKELAEAAGLTLQQTWNGLTHLVKVGYIKFEMGRRPHVNKEVRLYRRIIDISNSSLQSPEDIQISNSGPRGPRGPRGPYKKKGAPEEPPAPKAEDMQPDVSLPVSQQAVKDFIAQNEVPEEITVDSLLKKLDPTDVLLTCAAMIVDENRRLRALLKEKL